MIAPVGFFSEHGLQSLNDLQRSEGLFRQPDKRELQLSSLDALMTSPSFSASPAFMYLYSYVT